MFAYARAAGGAAGRAPWGGSVRLDQASRKTDAKWRIIIMMGRT